MKVGCGVVFLLAAAGCPDPQDTGEETDTDTDVQDTDTSIHTLRGTETFMKT